jgi:NADH-quinone oxidoreductase subunit A
VLKEYLGILLFAGVAFVIPLAVFIISGILATKKDSDEKGLTYECGMDTRGETWIQFKSGYFLYALVFVIFDVETVFLYPWAVKFQQLGLFAFVEMILFITILLLGYWFAWKEQVFKWK